MARNRQRAKERQAERRAARRQATGQQTREPAPPEDEPEVINADLGGAPSPLLGQSGFTLAHTSEDEEFIGDLQVHEPGEPDEVEDYLDDEAEVEEEAPAGPRGVRGGRAREEHAHREHGRVISFLIASWAELQRVQWPNRSQLTSLTGVTLAFVLIVGGYLGLLDAIFSRLVQAIL
jgi:preprotein translocase subunit SecE